MDHARKGGTWIVYVKGVSPQLPNFEKPLGDEGRVLLLLFLR